MSCSQNWRSAFALVMLLVTASAVAQPRNAPMIRPINLPKPEIDAMTLRSESPDSSRVDLYFAVPYRLLDFLYAGDKYVADYGAVIQVTDSATGRLILDRYQAHSVVEEIQRHEARMSKGVELADAQQVTLVLRPGAYDIRLMIRDLSSHHEYDTSVAVRVRDLSGVRPMMSDLLVYRQKNGSRILPAIGGDVGTVQPATSGIFALAYNLPDTAFLTYTVVTPRGSDDPELTRFGRIMTKLGAGPSAVFAPMDFSDLWMGSYDLRLYLLPRSFDTSDATRERLVKAAIAYADRQVHVSVLHGVPIAQTDLNDAIEQLRTIATASEWDSLSTAQTAFEKRSAILEFWRKQDPDPYIPGNRPMEVFYQRIEYANAHFETGGTPGWKTDRGRVMIALGEPDFIDRHPYEANQKPYEVWDYTRSGTRFYFVDQYLLGEYRLIGAPPPLGTFVWDQ